MLQEETKKAKQHKIPVPHKSTASELSFSVKIEVEEFDEELISDLGGNENTVEHQNIVLDFNDRSDIVVSTENEENYYFEIEEGIKQEVVSDHDSEIEDDGATKCKIKMSPEEVTSFKIREKDIYNALDELRLISKTLADRILQVEVRNTWGRAFHKRHQHSKHDMMVFKALNHLRIWTIETKLCFGGPPLMYKCYVCKKAWWHLEPFRVHIKKHNEEEFDVHLEICQHEKNIVARIGNEKTVLDIPIDSKCWQCGNDYNFHKKENRNRLFYPCLYCRCRFVKCSHIQDHLVVCKKYKKVKAKNPTRISEYAVLFKCHICKIIVPHKLELESHYKYFHTVRSDLLHFIETSKCKHCNQYYYLKGTHLCPKILYTVKICTFCNRKFPSGSLYKLHNNYDDQNYHCRICNEILPARCMELKHIVEKHNNNFMLLYKCSVCVRNTVLFLDEKSLKSHISEQHGWDLSKIIHCPELVSVHNTHIHFDILITPEN
jgi:hypothetical protein